MAFTTTSTTTDIVNDENTNQIEVFHFDSKPYHPHQDYSTSTELHGIVSKQGIVHRWELFLKRLTFYPQEASKLDDNLRTPLALVCAVRGIPSDVIRQLLDVYPKAASVPDKNGSYPIHFYVVTNNDKDAQIVNLLIQSYPDALISRNKFGNTPLQAAMETDTVLSDKTCIANRGQILKALIMSRPEAVSIRNDNGSFPLHFSWRDPTPDQSVAKLLVKLYDKATEMTNAYGATPLFMAINWDAPIEILEVLLKANPSTVKIKDKRGMCSISSAWNLFVHEVRVKDEQAAAREKERVKTNRKYLKMAATHLDLTGEAENWWNKMQLLLKAAYHNSVDNPLPEKKKWRVMHAAAGCDCPPELLRLVLKLCRVQLFIKDENNRLPLHIAASAPIYVKQPFESQSEAVISKLVSAYPGGALEVNDDGRLPLHIALESHKTWSDGIHRLVELHPHTARCPDPRTRLYPFMLAAGPSVNDERAEAEQMAKTNFKQIIWRKFHPSRKEREIENIINTRQADQVNTIFQLLLLAPDLINITDSSVDDKVLEKEKKYLKSSNRKLEAEYIEMLKDAETLKDMLEQKKTKSKSELDDLQQRLNALREEEMRITSQWFVEGRDDDGSTAMYEV